jgi:GNAT superfamily N-acetyltransferase
MSGFIIFITLTFFIFFMKNFDALKNNFLISTNKTKLDVTVIHTYLSKESYWAKNIPVAVVQKSIEGSFCFGVYKKQNPKEQIGFARVITDNATFGYLADVFIVEQFRGLGLSKWLMQEIMQHENLQGFRRWMLATKDAHGLYAQFGFTLLENTGRLMGFKNFEEYSAEDSSSLHNG